MVINLGKGSADNLFFETNFNRDISKLPSTIIHLGLGQNFKQQITFHPNIKYLKLNCNNQYIIDFLPNSIVELELGYDFNLQMDNLPTSIKKIIIDKGSSYNKDLNCLPDFVEELHLNRYYKKRILNIPSNLKKIICSTKYPYKNDFTMCIVEIY